MSTNRVFSAVLAALVLLSGVIASGPASASDNYVIESCGYCYSDAQFTEAAVNTGISGLVYMVNTNSHEVQAYAVVNEVEPGIYIRSATRVAGDAEVKQMIVAVLTILATELNKHYASGDLGLTHDSALDALGIPDAMRQIRRGVISHVSDSVFRQLRAVATDAFNNNSWASLFRSMGATPVVWVLFPDGSRVELQLVAITADMSGTDHEFKYEITEMIDSEGLDVPMSRDGFNHMTRTGPNGYVDRYRRAAERFGWGTEIPICNGECSGALPTRMECKPGSNVCSVVPITDE